MNERLRIRRAFSRITRVFHKGQRYTVCTDGMKFSGGVSGVYGAALHELCIIDEERDEYLRREAR